MVIPTMANHVMVCLHFFPPLITVLLAPIPQLYPRLSLSRSSLKNHSSHLTSILVNFQQLGHGPAAQQQHGHSHGAQPQQHGHSHGGKPCHGMFYFVLFCFLPLFNIIKHLQIANT
jgi:hypothetical protein